MFLLVVREDLGVGVGFIVLLLVFIRFFVIVNIIKIGIIRLNFIVIFFNILVDVVI